MEILQSKLSISISNIFLSDQLLCRFYDKVPSTHTTLDISDTTTSEVILNVEKMRSELGIMVLNKEQFLVAKNNINLKELEIFQVEKSPFSIHFHQDHPLAKKEKIYSQDLFGYTYLHFPYDFYSYINFFNKDQIQCSDFPKTLTCNHHHSIISLMKGRDTFVKGHLFQADELKSAGILTRTIEDITDPVAMVYVKRKREELSPNGKLFLELFANYYASQGPPSASEEF
ncbi:MAG: hypothetical protein RR626_02285 [Anaerovoracaceae bacterium]